jgi:hypothetical protein
MEKGRPGAWQPGYDDRPPNLLVTDPWIAPAVILQLQAVDEESGQVVTGGQSPQRVKACLRLERPKEAAEGFTKGCIAKVVKGGLAARRIDEFLFLKACRYRRADCAAHRIDRMHEKRAFHLPALTGI